MKKTLVLMALMIGSATILFAQTAKVKPYQMYSLQLMKPIHGHEQKFEDAVKAHITKFHPAGPHAARLAVITEGTGSDGWYTFTMGPLMYANLDNQPNGNNKEHDADWTNNIDPHIQEYGESNFWKLQEDLSFTPAGYNPDRIDVWKMDLKPGMKYQFAELMKKMKALYEAKKYPFSLRVFYNDLFSASGADASIVFSFKNYAAFDDDFKFRDDYEAMNGAGSWDYFWKQWNECVISTDEQLRKFIN